MGQMWRRMVSRQEPDYEYMLYETESKRMAIERHIRDQKDLLKQLMKENQKLKAKIFEMAELRKSQRTT